MLTRKIFLLVLSASLLFAEYSNCEFQTPHYADICEKVVKKGVPVHDANLFLLSKKTEKMDVSLDDEKDLLLLIEHFILVANSRKGDKLPEDERIRFAEPLAKKAISHIISANENPGLPIIPEVWISPFNLCTCRAPLSRFGVVRLL